MRQGGQISDDYLLRPRDWEKHLSDLRAALRNKNAVEVVRINGEMGKTREYVVAQFSLGQMSTDGAESILRGLRSVCTAPIGDKVVKRYDERTQLVTAA